MSVEKTKPDEVLWLTKSQLDEMQSEVVSPQNGLRWNNGVLEQAHAVTRYAGGKVIGGGVVWKAIPSVAGATPKDRP
jgi:hypothetical protein